MPGRKQLLEDFYAKYAPDQQLTEERLLAIDKKYGDNDEQLLKDFYAKYAPDEEVTTERIDAIYNKYGLKKKEPTTKGLEFGFKTASEALASTRPKPKVPLKSSSTDQIDIPRPEPRLSSEEQQVQQQLLKTEQAKKAQAQKQGVKKILYDNTRYWRLKDKQEAQARGYTNVEQMYKDREPYLINNYLDELDKAEASAQQGYLDAKIGGNEKAMSEYYQKYLLARKANRDKYLSQVSELDNLQKNVEAQSKVPGANLDFTKKTLDLIQQRREQLELTQKAVIDPKNTLSNFIEENATEIASVAKPTQTAYQKLREYTNALYTEVLTKRKELGLDGKMSGLDEYMADYRLRTQNDAGAELDDLYAKEQKLRQATKLLFLNRSSLEDESALGVIGKNFVTTVSPATQAKEATNQVVANNFNSIVQEADIAKSVYKDQQEFAEEEAKDYAPYSSKWFAAPIGSSMAIAAEFIPSSLLSEGVLGVTKIGRMVNLAEKYGKVKGLNTTAKYLDAVNKYKTLKAADTIGKFVIKTQANGLKFATTSEAVSMLFPSQEDEVNATSGYFGGVIGKGVEVAAGGLVGTLFKVFGDNAPKAAAAMSSMGEKLKFLKDAPKTVVGELGEEFGEELGNIYSESNSWKEIKSNLDERFGTLDKATQFVIQTGIMALGMGHGTAVGAALYKSSKDAYNGLSREQRQIVDEVLDSVSQEEQAIDSEVAGEVADEVKSSIKKPEEQAQFEEEVKAIDQKAGEIVPATENVTTIEELTPELEPIKEELEVAGKIVTDESGEVKSVKQNNGEESQLYKDLTSITGDKNAALNEYLTIKDDEGQFKKSIGDWENRIMKDFGRTGGEYEVVDRKLKEGEQDKFYVIDQTGAGANIVFNRDKLSRDRNFDEVKSEYIETLPDELKPLAEKSLNKLRDLKLHFIHIALTDDSIESQKSSLEEVERLSNIKLAKDYYGEPMIFMHAGGEGITKFRKPGDVGYKKNDELTGGAGIYFSRDVNQAGKYAAMQDSTPAEGKDIYYVFLKTQNPYYITDPAAQAKYPLSDSMTLTEKDKVELEKLGYDSVIWDKEGAPKHEVVVFSPEQIIIVGTHKKGFNKEYLKEESKQSEKPDEGNVFEKILELSESTKLKSKRKAAIKSLLEEQSSNDVITYIAENIDDIKSQLKDKVGLTSECKW